MNKSSLIRKVASALLLLCFVLPLSRCTYTNKDGVTSSNDFYAFSMVYAMAEEIVTRKINPIENIGYILMYLAIFIFPTLYIFLKPMPQSVVTILSSIPAFYFLYPHFYLYIPLIGGWLALISWVILAIISALTIWQHLPHNKVINYAPSAPDAATQRRL